jgi:Dyp-type peroxidase family
MASSLIYWIQLDLQRLEKHTHNLSSERLRLISQHLGKQKKEELRFIRSMKNQFGIEFPSPNKQEHILIIRANVASSNRRAIKTGLMNLCIFLDSIDKGRTRIEYLDSRGVPKKVSLWKYCFTSTLGFGIGFFTKLGIPMSKCPSKLKDMPSSSELGDPSPYDLSQTDIILQLASNKDYVNRWVLENAFEAPFPHSRDDAPTKTKPKDGIPYHDIVSTLRDWAIITDIHFGFQRTDGRNLMGFNDGISNLRRFSQDFRRKVWISNTDEKNRSFVGGTYIVFQKIEHDLEQWNLLDVKTQEEWVGRSKFTGLLLGTLSEEEDRVLFRNMSSSDEMIRRKAEKKWKRLIREQRDPKKRFYEDGMRSHANISLECPAWSHVRKANPRQDHGAALRLLFRRGYLYSDSSTGNRASSGLLFISFQNDILNTFEAMKKEWLNNKKFPVPGNARRRVLGERELFNKHELEYRHRKGRLTANELSNLTNDQRKVLGLLEDDDFEEAIEEARCNHVSDRPKDRRRLAECDLHSSGREGLSGPSENGVNPHGSLVATVPLGGGYYFVPPIPKGGIAQIGQVFF